MKQKRLFNNLSLRGLLPLLAVFLCLIGSTGQAWAGGNFVASKDCYVKAYSKTPAQGLVYVSTKKTDTPTYQQYYPSGNNLTTGYTTPPSSGSTTPSDYIMQKGTTGSTGATYYCWAEPARGYKFKTWNGYREKSPSDTYPWKNDAATIAAWNGVADKIVYGATGNNICYWNPYPTFEALPVYLLTYSGAAGGSYHVQYTYKKTRQKADGEYEFYTISDVDVADLSSSDQFIPDGKNSYSTDVVKLTTSAANFTGWYANGTFLSNSKNYTLEFNKLPAAGTATTITAEFKNCVLGSPEEADSDGDVKLSETTLGSFSNSLTIPVSGISGTWQTSDFTITFTNKEGENCITKGAANYSNGTLTIPYTYAPTAWGGTEVDVTIIPQFGETLSFKILASAEITVGYDACIGADIANPDYTGTLDEMIAQANTMDSKPIVTIMNDVEISSPLSFVKSMTFDINGNKVTSTGSSVFSVDAAGIDVKVVDGSFSQTGVIVADAAVPDVLSAVTFTQAGQLSLNGGLISVNNTSSDANAKAYGIYVKDGSVFLMNGGRLTATAKQNAYGIYVASAGDYATINGGAITVEAEANAIGVYSMGSANVADLTLTVSTTVGANAYGVYVAGGVSTFNNVVLTANAKTSDVCGAYVAAGRLNYAAGSISAGAATTGVYGVQIMNGATANIQQRAAIIATSESGANVMGVDNRGTLKLLNTSVTATAKAAGGATAVNSSNNAVSTIIEDGTFVASALGTAYGLHHQAGALTVDGSSFRATGEGNSIYGARATVDGTLKNVTLYAQTLGSGNTAYGFVGAVADKTITLNNCDITAISATHTAYGIFSRTNVAATDVRMTVTTQGGATAKAFYAESGTNTLKNVSATVSSYATGAFGIDQAAGVLTADGGTFNVTALQARTASSENSQLYGVKNSATSTTTISNVTFDIKAENITCSKNIYGMYAAGVLNATHNIMSVKGGTLAYGVYGTGSSSNLNLNNNNISSSATSTTDGYGIYSDSHFHINGDVVSASSVSTATYALKFTSTAEGVVADGKFGAMGNHSTDYGAIASTGTAGKVSLKGGVYNSKINLEKYTEVGYNVYNIDATHPDFADGYRYAVSTESPCPAVCYIVGGEYYNTLEAALEYVNNHETNNYTIVMTRSYTLPANDYRLPSNTTLLIPYTTEQTSASGSSPIKRNVKTTREEHMRLTLAAGVNLSVDGIIEVGGEMFCDKQGMSGYNYGVYARIHLEENSIVKLNGNAKLYAWGFVTGMGEIKALSNSEVHEMFQVGDMKDFNQLVRYYTSNGQSKNEADFFPISQYYIQNVEAPVTYYYNSKLICSMCLYVSSTYAGDDNVSVLGTSNSFLQVTSNDESSWIRKRYDATTDQLVWELNSSTSIGSITLNIPNPVTALQSFARSVSIRSANYILPIASNMKFNVLDGNCSLTQRTEFLPGSEVEIQKTASLTIPINQSIYLFDTDQWKYTITRTDFSPSWSNGTKPSRTFGDAKFNVHGTILVQSGAQFYTTQKYEGDPSTKSYGANIFSNNDDAGTVTFLGTADSSNPTIKMVTSLSGNVTSGYTATLKNVTLESALLKNGDGTFKPTAGAAAGTDFGYLSDAWHNSYVNGPFTVIDGLVYAKPSEYAQLKKQQTGTNDRLEGIAESDHTYLTIADKILILQGKGTAAAPYQWWEVEATATPGVFECKKEGYEGFYSYNATAGEWQLVKRSVTFYMDEAKTEATKKVVSVNYMGVPDQSVIATNPSKATTAAATYTFYGWKSSVTGNEFAWTATLEAAENDMYYTPVFTEKVRNYTITFNDADNNGAVKVEAAYGSHPQVVPSKPATAQYTYTFKDFTDGSGNHYLTCDELPTVTGAATYTANWTGITNVYTVIFKDGEQTLQTKIDQPYGTATAFAGMLPSKEADDEFAYEFDGWVSSQNGTKYANGSTPTVSGDVTYTAHYATTARYMITFANYDGTVLQKEATTVGVHPVYNGTPRRDADRDGYFRFDGWMDGDGVVYAAGAELPAVSKKQTYTAQWTYVTTVYTITFKNFDGNNGSWEGRFGEGETPSYDGATPLAKPSDKPAQYYYEFAGWTPTIDPVTGPATYTALWSDKIPVKYTITFVYDGYGNSIKKEYAYGDTPAYDTSAGDPTPHKDEDEDYTYNFIGWNPALAVVTEDATYTAEFEAHLKKAPVEELVVEGSETINKNTHILDLTITENGVLNIDNAATVTVVDNLFLEAIPDQNLGAVLNGNIEVTGNAYIDIDMNGSGVMNKGQYYSFAVPFEVNLNGGVYRIENGNAVQATPNTEFRVWSYSESERAKGKSDAAWIQQTSSGTLVPGVFYLLQVATNNANTYRFQWNKQGELNNHGNINNLSCTAVGSGEGAESGWHGVANNGLSYAKLSGNFTYVQVLNSEKNMFEGKLADSYPVAIGNPVFVQMTAAGNISMTASAPAAPASAPRRMQAYDETGVMNLQITKNGASKMADQIFFSASEDALNEYEVGKDVSKMFMGTAKAAQLWINAYDNKLFANEALMVDGSAEFDLSIFAPVAGEYELNLYDAASDVQVTLLEEGYPIADLSMMSYMLNLEAGTTNSYSISVRRKTPSVVTNIMNTNGVQSGAQKIMYEGKLYLINDKHVFDAQGKLIK